MQRGDTLAGMPSAATQPLTAHERRIARYLLPLAGQHPRGIQGVADKAEMSRAQLSLCLHEKKQFKLGEFLRVCEALGLRAQTVLRVTRQAGVTIDAAEADLARQRAGRSS